MTRGSRWLVLVGVLLFAGYVLYGSVSRVQVGCEVCLEFDGELICRKAAGADEEEALRAAQQSACGGQARGMSEAIACRNRVQERAQCTTGQRPTWESRPTGDTDEEAAQVSIRGVATAGIVGYLMVTGMRDSMVYYHTPAELIARVEADPSYRELGVKVGGRVTPGTVSFDPRTLDLRFDVMDIETGAVRFPVHY